MDKELLQFLSEPCNYPDRPATLTHYETHISHVFVGDDRVYKVKKPVNLGFLDFTTLRKRHFYCLREVALNARLAPHIYLGVTPIYRNTGGFSFTGSRGGRPAEYAVTMRRIPDDRILTRLIDEGRPLYGDMDKVGRLLAGFHARAPVYRGAPYGSLKALKDATEENFAQIAPFCGHTIDEGCLGDITTYTRDFLAGNRVLFRRRQTLGRTRDCHGDLHCQHVCLTDPPIIYDCIEFNKRFRVIDILEDLAFLLMDLECRGRFDLSSRLFSAYGNGLLRPEDEPVLTFFKVLRAVIRGKVESMQSADQSLHNDGAGAGRRAYNYFALAHFYIRFHGRKFNPVVFMGLSGSGKSTLAKEFFGERTVLRSDEIRKDLRGLKHRDHRYAPFGQGIYTDAATADTYDALLEWALRHGRAGDSVIVDATYLKSAERNRFHEASIGAGLNPFFVHCYAPEDRLKRRITERMADGADASDANVAILNEQLRLCEEPSELPPHRLLRLNTDAALHELAGTLREFL